jgi:ABC transport system ATP-binding/permease protein
MFKLVIQDDEGKTTVVPLIRDEITVGRKEGNTIRLTERNVSRRHARIMRANGSVAIEDLNSYNGVRVNGSRIQGRVDLHAADRIQIGDYLIELKAEAAEGAADPYGDQKTQPIERVDPMVATPPAGSPATAGNGAANASVNLGGGQIQGQPAPQAAQFGAGAAASGAAALADTDPGAQAAPQTPARMVILSNNFPGREFELSKPAMVIGRTDDNDIVVNHRSISRHHAKIVQENGRFAIVDLQSSNGVRVNGEDYGKVELRRGDVVDLGHVRMRFVEAGEDFLFGRDAQAVDVTTGAGKGLVAALVALLLVGGGVGAYMLTRGGDDSTQQAQASDTSDPDQAAAATLDPADAGAEQAIATNPEVGESSELKAALDEARQAIQDENWDEAAARAAAALAIEPGSETARQLADQAASEKANLERFNNFQKAVKKRDFAGVAGEFATIEHGSVYRDRAIDDHDRLREQYIDQKRTEARRLSSRGKCSDIRRLETEARRVWVEAGDVVAAIEKECRDKQVAADTQKGKDTPRNTGSSTSGGTSPRNTTGSDTSTSGGTDSGGGTDASSGGKSADVLKAEAQAAIKASQYGKALRLCEQALAKNPRDLEVTTICVVAACNLKNKAKALKYYPRLNTGRKTMARSFCLQNGIELE